MRGWPWFLSPSAPALAVLLLTAGLLSAQAVPSQKTRHSRHSATRPHSSHKAKKPEAQPALDHTTLSLGEREVDSQRIDFLIKQSDSYRVPVNFKLLIPENPTSAGGQGKGGSFSIFTSKPGLQFAPVASTANRDASSHNEEPEYFARHVPVVGNLMERMVHQSKAHPKVTRVLQVVHPEF